MQTTQVGLVMRNVGKASILDEKYSTKGVMLSGDTPPAH